MKSKYEHNRRWFDRFIDYPYQTIAFIGLFFLFSYQGFRVLDIRQFPFIPSGVIRILTVYPGADSQTIAQTVTEPLERSVAQAESFDYILSSSQDNISVIEAHLKTGQDIQALFPSVLAAVQSSKKSLPQGIDDPILTKTRPNSIALMYVSYTTPGSQMHPAELYHYLENTVRPQLLAIPNIGSVQILGSDRLAARLWVDHEKLNDYGINLSDLAAILSTDNLAVSGGFFENDHYRETLSLHSQVCTLEELENLAIKDVNGYQILLKDIGQISIGGETEDNEVYFNGSKGVFLSIDAQPNANALSVLEDVRLILKQIQKQLPKEMNQKIVYDASVFIQDSIIEVFKTFFEACLIVLIVVYFCLGSWRMMIVPIAAILCSLLGVFAAMAIFNVTINLLTLLALILSIGLVVDDAILVIEHSITCYGHAKNPMDAVKLALRELHNPIIVMTIILAIAYLPLVFLKGMSGYLFREFAFTLACAVMLSGMIALVLSPIMTVFALKTESAIAEPYWFMRASQAYSALLKASLREKKILKYFVVLLYPLGVILFYFLPSELAPKEDQGFAMFSFDAPQTASLSLLKRYSQPLESIISQTPDVSDSFFIYGSDQGVYSGFGGILGSDFSHRSRSMESMRLDLTQKIHKQSELDVFVFTPSSLPGPDGLDYQCVIYGPHSYEVLVDYANQIADALKKTGYFPFLRVETAFNKIIRVASPHRDFLKQNHISLQDVATHLSLFLNDFQSSKVLYQDKEIDFRMRLLNRDFFTTWRALTYHHVHDFSLDELFDISLKTDIPKRTHFNQMNSVKINGAVFPIVSFDHLISVTQNLISNLSDTQLRYDFTGPMRTYVQEGTQLGMLALEALIAMTFFLIGLFQSFFDTVLILTTIPLALIGALSAMHLSHFMSFLLQQNQLAVTYNIYTQLSLLTLFGLITKHGILIVDEIRKVRSHSAASMEDIVLAAAQARFRPIVMTTLCMILGVFPLIFAQGSGAICRYHMGLVIFFGLGLGTCFTLFIFPSLYLWLYSYCHESR